jgi:hypothetical protein
MSDEFNPVEHFMLDGHALNRHPTNVSEDECSLREARGTAIEFLPRPTTLVAPAVPATLQIIVADEASLREEEGRRAVRQLPGDHEIASADPIGCSTCHGLDAPFGFPPQGRDLEVGCSPQINHLLGFRQIEWDLCLATDRLELDMSAPVAKAEMRGLAEVALVLGHRVLRHPVPDRGELDIEFPIRAERLN